MIFLTYLFVVLAVWSLGVSISAARHDLQEIGKQQSFFFFLWLILAYLNLIVSKL